ncbi:hypothetical protein AB0D27_28555 [Streptomyces sp. NPDC048415]|uniref:hypothetical protein n=1 Tax=Streptomyces sp. NPDC048415 TaxID=3154822 RepID=UPI00341C1579
MLDSIQLPLLTEAAAQALAGWTQMDFMNRRDTLKLAVGAPLILAAERMLGGTARALNHDHKGFDVDTVTALEEVTAFFTKADASKGGGLYRSAIVAQLDEVARRIQDGVPPKLRPGCSRQPPTSRRSRAGPAMTPGATASPNACGVTARTPLARPGSATAGWRSSPACPTR